MDVIREALSNSGHDVSRLSAPFAGRPSALGNCLFAFVLQFWFQAKLFSSHLLLKGSADNDGIGDASCKNLLLPTSILLYDYIVLHVLQNR